MDICRIDRDKKLEVTKIMLEDYLVTIHWKAEVILDPYTNRPYITSFIRRTIANQFLGTKEYSHPDSAWEYFKQKYFPNWLQKYFPVKMKTIIFSFRAVFPDYEPPKEWQGNWVSDVKLQK